MAVKSTFSHLAFGLLLSVLMLIIWAPSHLGYGKNDDFNILRYKFDGVSMEHFEEPDGWYEFATADFSLWLGSVNEKAERSISVFDQAKNTGSILLRVDEVTKTNQLLMTLPGDAEELVRGAVDIAAAVLTYEQAVADNLPDDVISLLEHIREREFSVETESDILFLSEATYARGNELTYYGVIGRDPWRLLHLFVYEDRAIVEVRQTERGEGRLRVFFADGKLSAAYYGEKASLTIDANLIAAVEVLLRAQQHNVLHIPGEILPEFIALCSKIAESSHYDSCKSRDADAFESHGVRFGLGAYL